ncbi:MAG TPA: hypothetical protein PKA60_00400 [Candidatus Paceibacterota bacterium]|nr:hypothetical protein [Candidatus Paceibacterota bacterium]
MDSKIEVVTKNIDLSISPQFLWFLLLIITLIFIIMYFVFRYHWKSYGVSDNPKVFASPLFWIVSILLLVIMAFAVTGFEYL